MGRSGLKSDHKVANFCYEINNLKKEWDSSLDVGGHNRTVRELIGHVRAIGRAGEPEAVFATERAFLEHEQKYQISTPEQSKSLKNALVQLAGAESTLAELRDDPGIYRNYAFTHTVSPKNRIGDLPKDQARDYFRSQHARLTNLRKSPQDELTHKLYEARREALQSAEKTYIELQREVLDMPA